MLLEDLDKSMTISFLKQGKIPLGMNSYKGNSQYSREKIICMPYKKYSGALGIVGESGTGKTVVAKRVYSYLLGFYQSLYKTFRPGLIFDMSSEDHHYSKFPNKTPFNLFFNQGEQPLGLDNIECYAPFFIKDESHYFDNIFGFSIDQFHYRDFLSLGMGHSAAKMCANLIRDNPKSSENLKLLYDALMDIPKNSTEFRRLSEDYLFKLDKHKNYSAVNSLQDNITPTYNDNVFVDKNSKYCKNDLIIQMKDNKIVLVNFHQEEKYYPLYAGKMLRDVYVARRTSKRKEDMGFKGDFPPPIIIIEEADQLVPNTKILHAGAFYLLEILKRGRKYDIMTMVITQEASAMNDKIRDHTRQWIVGRCVANDYSFFNKFVSDQVLDAIKSIDKTKYEFVIIYPDNTFDTFYAWNSPLEINRESRLEM